MPICETRTLRKRPCQNKILPEKTKCYHHVPPPPVITKVEEVTEFEHKIAKVVCQESTQYHSLCSLRKYMFANYDYKVSPKKMYSMLKITCDKMVSKGLLLKKLQSYKARAQLIRIKDNIRVFIPQVTLVVPLTITSNEEECNVTTTTSQ